MPSDDVIPLTRFRAALARARRGRKAEAMISEPNAEALVPKLPVQELFYAIKETGLADALELVALASPEQVQGFIDLDAWQRDRLDESRMREWVDALVEAGPVKLLQVVAGLDPELVALYIQRQARVYDLSLEEPLPEEPAGHFYPTPDRFFLLDILSPAEEGRALERFIDWLYRADLEFARHVVMSAKWEQTADLEEHSLRWRTGRMADLGYADYYDALSIYRWLDPASVKTDERTAEGVTVGSSGEMPTQLAGIIDASGRFARALGTLQVDAEIERLQSVLMVLVNKAMAADLVDPGDIDRAKQVLERSVAYLDLGLEYLTREPGPRPEAGVASEASQSDTRAGQMLRSVALERIFRVGVSLTLKLKRAADTLARAKVAWALYDEPWAEVLAALRAPRPAFPRILGRNSGRKDGEGGTRPFSTLADVARAASALEEAAQIPRFVLGGFGATPEALAQAVQASITPPDEVRYGTLVRTAAAHVLCGRPPSLDPLRPRDLKSALKRRSEPGFTSDIARAFRARLDERGLPHPPALDRWLLEWLAQDGVLVKYSWLK